VLNALFKSDRKVPDFKFVEPGMKNAYWDGKTYHAPHEVQDIPDVTYHEMAQFFIQQTGGLPYRGQSGAIVQSYAAVLASLVKQRRLHQTAETANWLLAEGFVAWITGKDVKKEKEKSALMSLKEPGSAYDDPMLGKDGQPKHMKDYVETQAVAGGVHFNSGILNKAFYETAIRIGSDRAGAIWLEALPKVAAAKTKDFSTLAKLTYEIASSNSTDQQTVHEAWAVVGLDPTRPSQTSSVRSKRRRRDKKGVTGT
jgi:Zn-dependent metalloprotease